MKILYLAPHLSTGGMPQFLLKRIESLREYTDNEYYVVEYECYSLDFVVQRNAIKSLLLENFTTLGEDKMELFKIIEEWHPDIVHIDEMSEMFDRQMITKLYDSNRKYKIVETCHNISFKPNEEKLFHPDLYAFCTPYHEQTFAYMDSDFATIQYPIDKQESFVSYNENVHVLNVGLWTPGKNQAEGIEIARKYPKMIFHFVGNQAGNFKEYWEPLMKDLPKNVKVWGERRDVDTFMRGADIFMFNSTWECNPLALREAISYGLPIIARNLPQYGDMFSKYIQPIDTDLNTIKANYEIPTDNTMKIFAFRHEEAYNKILQLPIQKQKMKITQHFVDNPYLEINGISDNDFKVQFLDEKGSIAYENTIKSNHWIKLNRQYFTNWTTKVFDKDEIVYANTLNLNDKIVYISLESKSLGDTLAWIPYCEEFRKKHQCHLVVSTFLNKILNYPEIEFVEPGTVVNCYALYRLGWFYNENKEPEQPNTIPMQKAATNILGLDYQEIKPKIKFTEVEKDDKLMCIGIHSTAQAKYWNNLNGWKEIVDWLKSEGYRVKLLSKEGMEYMSNIAPEGLEWHPDGEIEDVINELLKCKMFIGIGSGLSWLSWGLNVPTVIISGFSEKWAEMKDCIRIGAPLEKCSGCFNRHRLDAGDWDWCPDHKGTERQYECTKYITSKMVIDKIKNLL